MSTQTRCRFNLLSECLWIAICAVVLSLAALPRGATAPVMREADWDFVNYQVGLVYKPTANSSVMNPEPMPRIWGMVRTIPKFTPEASNIRLFDPGVTDVTALGLSA